MKKVLLLNPSVASGNKGDEIIMEGINQYLVQKLMPCFTINGTTHLPMATFREVLKQNSWRNNIFKQSDYTFVCGSNLLSKGLYLIKGNNWHVHFWTPLSLNQCILVGCGLSGIKHNYLYTKWLYNKLLSKKYIHSVRDGSAVAFLSELGIQAINTGCPSTWGLTPEHCQQIPTKKANHVIFTLTDYHQDFEKDKQLVAILFANYQSVSCWIQGFYDYDYLKLFPQFKQIQIIPPTVQAFEEALQLPDIEYVGTRLHAGIKAIQLKKRSIILAIDNRASSIHQDIELNCIPRTRLDLLPQMINSSLITNLKIDFVAIQTWLNQFGLTL